MCENIERRFRCGSECSVFRCYLTHFLQPWQCRFFGPLWFNYALPNYFVPAPFVLSARLAFIRNTHINKATWTPPGSKIKATIRHFTEHYPNYNDKHVSGGFAHAFVNTRRREPTMARRKVKGRTLNKDRQMGVGAWKMKEKKQPCPNKSSYKDAPLTNEGLF